jgi:formylglycine-generating enzyme required for sulfatase activity
LEWVYWILTCIFSCYFVVLLLEFNRPSQKLMEQIDAQEARRLEMARRLQAATEGVVEMDSRLERLTNQMDELEESRIAILPEANKRLMVYVPPGPVTMGGRDEDSPRNEQPAHTVHLTGYYIGKTPVTNQEYREFVQCTGYRAPIHWQRGTFPTGMGKHPVTNVTWRDACAYAAWRGAKLPTEAEWEKAARGTDERPYPWGGRFTEGERCNASGLIGTTTPVDEFPEGRSFYEAWDMAGNVYEWCADHYDEEYYHDSPATNPPGPEGGQEGTIRGGSYQETRAALRTTHRAGAAEGVARDTIGFRVAMPATAEESQVALSVSEAETQVAEASAAGNKTTTSAA